MANELIINYPSSSTLYALLFDSTGNAWNGSAFAAPGSANWLDYDIAMSEIAGTGIYRASMPAAAAGSYGWVVRKQAGGSPAVSDIAVGSGEIEWDGTAEIMPASTTNITGGTINSVSGSIGGKVLGGGSDTITGIGAQVASSGLTAQQTADAVNNLAPASTGATGSIRAKLDAIKLITDAIDTSAVTVTASNDAGVLALIQSVTFGATVSGLTISATWAKLYFTLKWSEYDDDDAAIVQLVASNPAAPLTDGLLYLDGAAVALPLTIANGTLTVSQAAGTVAIAITDNATVLLAKASGLYWDIKTKDAAGATVQNTTGTASILRAVTQTI